MAHASTKSESPSSLGFVIAGHVTWWDPRIRLLELDGEPLWLHASVRVRWVVIGQRAVAAGHQKPTGERVVTRLHFDWSLPRRGILKE